MISRAENNVILTAYLVIITDNLVAVCGNFIFAADYSNIRCFGNSIFITINKVILGILSFSTGYFILYACKLGVFSVISLVAAADCHYGAACIFVIISIFTIPGMRILTNSNITAYGLSANTIPNRNMCTLTNGYVQIIRCRISSHRRSHACTGHHTCCNQHCQQLFGRAAFAAMIFRNFGDNNVSVARLTPITLNTLFIKNSSHINNIIYILYVTPATCGNKLNSCFSNCPAIVLPRFQASAILQ